MNEISFESLDRDGSIAAAFEDVFGHSRARFLRNALLGGGALLLARPRRAEARVDHDTATLRFDLRLEYLQAAMYTEAERLRAVPARTLAWARVVGAHERAHVLAIRSLLGRDAVPSPSFDFGRVTSDNRAFTRTAVAFEDLTAALLKWQAPRLESRHLVAAVASLHSVEARHAAWIRHVEGREPAPNAFDMPRSQTAMANLVSSTGFVTDPPRMKATSAPAFTG